MKYAWIENEKIRDIAHDEPLKIYHPDIAQFYDTLVPNDAANNDGWVNGQLVKREPKPIYEPPRTWSVNDIRSGLTLAERVKWDSDETATIKTAKIELTTPKKLDDVTEILDMLVNASDISQQSMDNILA